MHKRHIVHRDIKNANVLVKLEERRLTADRGHVLPPRILDLQLIDFRDFTSHHGFDHEIENWFGPRHPSRKGGESAEAAHYRSVSVDKFKDIDLADCSHWPRESKLGEQSYDADEKKSREFALNPYAQDVYQIGKLAVSLLTGTPTGHWGNKVSMNTKVGKALSQVISSAEHPNPMNRPMIYTIIETLSLPELVDSGGVAF